MNSPTWNNPPPPPKNRSGSKTASNISLIDWDKSVLNYVYACMYPPSYSSQSQHQTQLVNSSRPPAFRKAHRRIVSATSPRIFQPAQPGLPKLSRLAVSRVRGHCRNASDPGMHIYFPPPPPIFLPPSTTTLVDEDGYAAPPATVPSPPSAPPPSPPQPICPDMVDETITSSRTIPSSEKDCSCLIPCLQPWTTSLVLLIALCAMAFFQSLLSTGYLGSIITTLERRFDLTLRQVGYMYCCYEVTSGLATIAFSFVDATKVNRPRIIGAMGLIFAAGFGLFALPHWLSGPYNPGKVIGMQNRSSGSQALCSVLAQNASSTSIAALPPPFVDRSRCNQTEVTLLRIGHEAVIASDYTVALPLFCCAMAIAGFGSSALFILAPTFFWDNMSPELYPLYSGLLYSSAGLGPAFGFLAGSAFFQIYIDAPSVQPPLGSQLNVNSPSWLGAWWMGMLIFGALSCLPALPVLLFPKRLPPHSNEVSESEEEEAISITADTAAVS